jgi:tape measure domain-containing protein
MRGMDDLIIRAAIINEMSAPLDRIHTDLDAMARAVARVVGNTDRMTTATGAAGRAVRQLTAEEERLERQTHAVARAMNRLDTATDAMVRRSGVGLLAFARRGSQALGVLAGAAAVFGTKTALSVQSARGAFKNFTADPEGLLAQIQGLDATKALGIGVTASVTAKLGGFGVGNLPGSVAALTDAAFLSGSEGASERLQRLALALGQVQTKGRIQAEEALQFAEAGVPIFEKLAAAIGVSQGELSTLLSSRGGSARIFEQIGGAAGLAQIIGGGNTKGAAKRATNSSLGAQIRARLNGFGGAVSAGYQPTLDRLSKLVSQNEKGLNGFEATVERVVGQNLLRLLDSVVGFWNRSGKTIKRELTQLGRDFMDFARLAGPVIGDALAVAAPLFFGLTRSIGFLTRVLRPVSFLLVPLAAGLAGLLVFSRIAKGVQAASAALKLLGGVMNVLRLAALTNPFVIFATAAVGLGGSLPA